MKIPTAIGMFCAAVGAGAIALGMAGQQPKNTMTNKTNKNGLYLVKNAPKEMPEKTEFAMFGAGCFWGVEQEFRKEPGVIATAVGFAGGRTKNPTYKDVCYTDTGHAEVVRIEFDPKVTSYEKLIRVFWDLHDPTTLNQQGPDIGDQYRSVVFFYSPEQRATSEKTRDELQNSGELGGKKIVTFIQEAPAFYKAEEYHQQYVEKGGFAVCHRRKSKTGG